MLNRRFDIIAVVSLGLLVIVLGWLLIQEESGASAIAVHPSKLAYSPNEENRCGPLCLYLIGKYHGDETSIDELLKLTKSDGQGVSFLDIKNAALELGFSVEPMSVGFESLVDRLTTDRSGILYFGGGHFAAVFDSPVEGRVRLADPFRGVEDVNNEALVVLGWSGKTMFFEKG